MKHRTSVLWFIAAILTIAATGARAEDVAKWQHDIRDPIKKQADQYIDGLTVLDANQPPPRVDQLVVLSVENDNLVVRTPAPSTPPPAPGKGFNFKMKVAGNPDWASLRLEGGAAGAGKPVIPHLLRLGVVRYLDDRIVSWGVVKDRGLIGATFDVNDSTGISHAQIIEQDPNDDFSHPHTCTLTVFKSPLAPKTAPKVSTFTEPTFELLLQRHPEEAHHYLRTLFHKLNADFVFATAPPIGWQVFADAWKPDPQAAAAVRKLLPLIATGTFRQRNDARKSLEDLGTPGAMSILQLDRTTLTAEQNAQLDRATQPYHQLTDAQAKSMRTNPQFLVDCLYCSDGAIRAAAIAQLRKATRLDLPFDPAAKVDARLSVISALVQKIVDAKIITFGP